MFQTRIISTVCIGLLGLLVPNIARAQEAINFNSALQPAKDTLIVRQQLRYFEADFANAFVNRDIEQYQASTTFAYGVQSDLTLIFNAPFRFRKVTDNLTGVSHRDEGFGDMTALTKIQLYQNDTGPTDTARLNLLAGMEVRSGDSNFSSDSYDPLLGGVYTQSIGRHGFDAALLWKFNTNSGDPDRLRYDTAYVYRLQPESYGPGKMTALFGVIELNGYYETNGDNELFISPGIQYVTGKWALEATVQLPIWQDLDERMERDFVIGLSFRLHF